MAYPSTLDSLDNPLASDPRVGHAALHGAVNDAIEALEAKVGTGASTPATIGDVLTVTGTGATAWQTPSAGGGLLVSDPVTLTSADILALYDTPVEVVAAPGAGKFLVPHLVIANTSGGTVAYTIADAIYVNVGDAPWVEVTSLFSVVTGDQVATFIPAAVTSATADVENGAMTIVATDDNPADGDGDVTFTVWYSIEDVP